MVKGMGILTEWLFEDFRKFWFSQLNLRWTMDNEISFSNGHIESSSTQWKKLYIIKAKQQSWPRTYYLATFSINSSRRKSAAGCKERRDSNDSFFATVIKAQSHNLISENPSAFETYLHRDPRQTPNEKFSQLIECENEGKVLSWFARALPSMKNCIFPGD